MKTPNEIKKILEKSNVEQVLLFDGVCNLCNSTVDFLIKREPNKQLKYASLQSEFGCYVFTFFESRPDSIILLTRESIYIKSDAALQIAKHLKQPYRMLAVFRIIPSKVRNKIYSFIAANRHRWFGQRNSCRVASQEEQNLFIEKL